MAFVSSENFLLSDLIKFFLIQLLNASLILRVAWVSPSNYPIRCLLLQSFFVIFFALKQHVKFVTIAHLCVCHHRCHSQSRISFGSWRYTYDIIIVIGCAFYYKSSETNGAVSNIFREIRKIHDTKPNELTRMANVQRKRQINVRTNVHSKMSFYFVCMVQSWIVFALLFTIRLSNM